MVKKFDFLVIGSGIAGMSFALKVAHKGKVALICKSGLEEANTYFAQGGVASVTNLLVDNFDKHIEDTMIAGDWISDRAAVEKVVREAPAQIEALINWGVRPAPRRRALGIPHSPPQRQYRRRNTGQSYQSRTTASQYYGYRKSFRH